MSLFNCIALASTLQDVLGLDRPPVGMAPVDTLPEGVRLFSGVSPSACSFWPLAERGLFAARDADHMNCPVGAKTMGFRLTQEAEKELQQGVAMMCQVNYINPTELGHLPSMSHNSSFMLYGPLTEFPLEPEVVLIWVQPAQAMLLREATGDAEWKGEPPAGVFGRPACAALAIASEGESVAFSFGCAGMRTFTEIEPSYLLAALSGPILKSLESRLIRVKNANCAMQDFYNERKGQLSLKPKMPSEQL